MNLVKTNTRATLANESLQDLLALNSEKLEMSEFDLRLVGGKAKTSKSVPAEKL